MQQLKENTRRNFTNVKDADAPTQPPDAARLSLKAFASSLHFPPISRDDNEVALTYQEFPSVPSRARGNTAPWVVAAVGHL